MAAVLVAMGAFVYLRMSDDLLASVDAGLRSRAQVLADAIGGADEQRLVGGRGTLIDPDEAFAQVLDVQGRIVDASPGVRTDPLIAVAEATAAASGPVFLTRDAPGFDDPVRILAVDVRRPERHAIVVVGATLGDLREALDRLLVTMATIGPAALIVNGVAGWLLAGAALRPVEAMGREAAAISASEPERRLPVPATGDELARLAGTLNAMLDRLQVALERERRFVDDASHELRTPLATLRAEIELSLARPREVSELEATLRSAQDDVDRLQRLTEDLLVLARTRGGTIPLRRVPTHLPDLIARSVRSVERQALAATIRIELDAMDETFGLDPDRVEQALRNLLENAIRHSTPGDIIRITARRSGDMVTFVVSDRGPGFAPGILGRAFEPFARDNGHGTYGDGTGLGLAIVRAVAEAHGGYVKAENSDGARVTLTVRA
jgi:signal transduction histidine kinase